MKNQKTPVIDCTHVARAFAFFGGLALMFTSVDAITAQSRGANSYLGETSFMALILRQQGRQTFGLGFLAMAGSMVGVKLAQLTHSALPLTSKKTKTLEPRPWGAFLLPAYNKSNHRYQHDERSRTRPPPNAPPDGNQGSTPCSAHLPRQHLRISWDHESLVACEYSGRRLSATGHDACHSRS